MRIVAAPITLAEVTTMAGATFGGTPEFVEFDSMINLRPGQGNRTQSVEDPATRETIERLVGTLVVR